MNQKHLPSSHRINRSTIQIILFATMVWAMIFFAGIEKGQAQTLIAGWDFQTTSNGGTAAASAPGSPTVFLANFGSGTIFLNGSNNSSSWITTTSGNEITSFGGSNLNTSGTGFSTTTTTPACLALLGGALTGGVYTANGKCLVFTFSMTGYQNLVVSYVTQRTGTGFTSQAWDYSTDGTNWNSAQTLTGLPTSYAVQTLSTITGLNNASTAYLRLTLTGATASSGNNRIDNIQFNAVSGVSNSITLTPATQNFGPFCNSVSNNVSLAYTTTGTVTSPFIELSSASGSFATGTSNLGGTVTAGTITATIPQNQAAGTLYRVRIKSTDTSPVISSDNGSNITVNGALTPSVSINDPGSVCPGQTVIFTPVPSNIGGGTASYSWTINGVPNAATGAAYTQSSWVTGNSVQAVMTLSGGCVSTPLALSNTVIPTISASTPSVGIAITTGSNPACAGTPVTFTATPSGLGGGTENYQWQLNGSNAGGNTNTYSLTPSINDIIQCGITVTGGCVTTSTAGSSPITMTVNPVPVKPVVSSNSPVCAGSALTLTSDATGIISWTGPDNFTDATQNPIIPGVTTAAGGTYNVTSTVSGCTSEAGSTSVTVNTLPAITVHPAPATIYTGGSNTFSVTATGSGIAYQWKLNGTDIPAANSGTYTVTSATLDMSGNSYTCVVSGICLPSVTSNPAILTVLPTPIAAWDFNGVSNANSANATTFNVNLNSSNLITRGPSAAASAGANSFRTTGFQNNGISTANTDYFQITLGSIPGYKLSVSTIDAKFNGTSTYYATPGVTSQFAYSLDGTDFNLIGSPVTSSTLTMAQLDLSSFAALQNIYPGTTLTIRYYASGQTTTGGWGFYSASAGQNGLAIGGKVEEITYLPTTTTPDNKSVCSGTTAVTLTASVSPNPGSGTIQFYIDGSAAGSPVVVSSSTGIATFVYNPGSLTAGSHSIRADFSGNNIYQASSSDPGNNGTLAVNPLPAVTAGNVNGCAGSPIALSGTPAGGSFSVADPYTGPGTTYTHTYTDGNGCTNTSTPATITVISTPDQPAIFTIASPYVSINQTGVVYTVTNDPAATSYNWSYSGSGATIVGSGNSISVDFSNTATAGTLSVTASNSCGTSSALTMSISVNPPSFTAGRLVVLKTTTTVSKSSSPVTLQEITTTGTPGATIVIPSSATDNYPFQTGGVFGGSEGFLTTSTDGRYLMLGGYGTSATIADITATTAASTARVVGEVTQSGFYSQVASSNTFYNANDIRGAVSDGTKYWGSGASVNNVDGIDYYGPGSQAGLGTLASNPPKAYGLHIFGGDLYFSTQKQYNTIANNNFGIFKVTGLPATNPVTISQIINTGSNIPEDFSFNPTMDVCYIAINLNTVNGGIQKWTKTSGVWTKAYTLGTGVTNIGAYGLVVDYATPANPVLYATTFEVSGNRVIKITDNGSVAASPATTLVSATAGSFYKGIAFSPVDSGTPTVNLKISTNTGSEAAATAITVTAVSSSPVSLAQTVSLGVSGTGITTGDYTLSDAVITIPAGSTTGSVTFTVVDDAIFEPTETAILTISNPSSGIVLGTTTTQTISIYDNDNTAPTISINTTTTSDYIDGGATVSPSSPYILTGVIADITDPASTLGIDFAIFDAETPATDLTFTATSSNATVVPNANLVISGSGAIRNVKITPAGVGYSNITVRVSDGLNTSSYVIAYAASVRTPDIIPANTFWHTGMSDASDGIALDNNYYISGDDELDYLNVFSRSASGFPLVSYNYSSNLALPDPGHPEVDLEAATVSPAVANKMYWSGSMSNGAAPFDNKPNRDRLFATTVTGTGASTAFTFAGYVNIKAALLAWGDANGFSFTASAAAGVDSKSADGFSLEGMVFGPDNTTLYLGMRAPLVPTTLRTKAVIAPILNFETWFNNGSPAGDPTFGAPIELNLNNKGIRDIIRLSNGTYILIAGNPGDGGANDLYKWTGNPADAPVLVPSAASGVLKMEGIIPVYNNNAQLSLSQIQVVTDGGDVVLYNDGVAAKDLPQSDRKFRSDLLTGLDLDICTGFSAAITPDGSTTFCSGGSVLLTAAAGNNVNNSYLWSNQATTAAITVSTSNTYTVTVTHAGLCTATASQTVTVNPVLPVSVSIAASANPVNMNTSVTFTATPVNEGTAPVFQWKKNGSNVGTNNPVYTCTPVNNDVITCALTSNASCTTGSPATSNAVTMTVNRPADSLLVTIPSKAAIPGDVLFYPVKLKGAGNNGTPINSANIQISYDPAVLHYETLVNFYPGMPSTQWNFSGNPSTVAADWIAPGLLALPVPDSTTLFEIKFTYLGGNCSLPFTVNEFTDATSELIPTNHINGGVTQLVPTNNTVQNVNVLPGHDTCFSALQVITVAGSGTSFIVQNGASANFVAGQMISILPGAMVVPGGYLHGYITLSGQYCTQLPNPVVTARVTSGTTSVPGIVNSQSIRVYPNPTTGKFTVEMKGESQATMNKVEIYSMSGLKVHTETLDNVRKHEFSMPQLTTGIYFIHVFTTEKSETIKIVKL